MAVTLAQAKLNVQDDLQAGIIDEFAKSTIEMFAGEIEEIEAICANPLLSSYCVLLIVNISSLLFHGKNNTIKLMI